MWEVYAYWNVEQLEAIFNGVAAISRNNAYSTLLFAMAMLGFLVVMGVAVARLRAEEPIVWIFFLTFFYGVLFVPKDSVVIIDRTAATTAPRVVANVPLGLAFFAHTTSKVGDWLTRAFETVFALPNEVRFTGNGMLFGSRIIRGAMASHLLDVQFNQDLAEYVRSCVAPDLLTGYKSLEDLMKTENIWGYMGDTNPARAVWINGSTMTCPQGYNNLNSRLPTALQAAHLNVARLINPNLAMTASPAALNAALSAQIPAAANVLMRVSSANSMDFVRQAIMVNFWRDAPGSMAAAVENTSAAQLAIAQSQAQASANSAYLTMAAIAEGALPKIRNVVQIIVISIFPIMLILVLMAGHKGGYVLKSYVMAMVWIELWPVLYAVTSYVGHLAAAPGVSSGLIGGLAAAPTGPGLSLLNSVNIEDTLLRDEAVAGMFSLLIPLMAYAIIKGGEVAMSGLASQIMAPATSAAQKAGSEAGVGNINMGNVRYDTFAARNYDANSLKSRATIASGPMPGQAGGVDHTDPGMGTVTGAAGKVFTTGGAPVAVQPSGGGAQVAAASATERASGVTQTGQTSLAVGQASTLVDQIAARSSEGTQARVGEQLAEAIARRTGSVNTAESGTGSKQDAGVRVGAKGDAGATSGNNLEDTLQYSIQKPGSLPGAGQKGAPASAAAATASGGGAAAAGLAGKGGLTGTLLQSLQGGWTHRDTDSFKETLNALTSRDANKARQAYREVGEAKRYLDDIAASPDERRGVREAAKDLSRALDKTLSAARQENRALTDTDSVTETKGDSSRAGVTASAASNLAAHQVLARALGHDPQSPQGLLAAAEFASRHPQAAQQILDSARDKAADAGVLAAAGEGPTITREALREAGETVVPGHAAGAGDAVAARDAANRAAYGPLARAMTGLDPDPDGRVGAAALAGRLKAEMGGVKNMNMAEQRQAYVEYGAARAAVELHRQELKARGEDFDKLDPRRLGQIQSRLLAEAERQEKAGDPQLRVWLENEGKRDGDLPGVSLQRIQSQAGIRPATEKEGLTWDSGRPQIQAPAPTGPNTFKPAPGQKG